MGTLKFPVALVLILLFSACGSEHFSYGGIPEPDVAFTVYSASSYTDGSVTKACYWINGKRVNLDLPGVTGDSWAKAITVSDDKVYIAGYYYDGSKDVACYWADGVLKNLDVAGIPGTGSSYPEAIAVSGDTVYIAGFGNDIYNPYGCYWENETRISLELPPGILVTSSSDIIVSEGDVYVTGMYQSDDTFKIRSACYWINGELALAPRNLNLTGLYYHSYAGVITVSDNVVYAAGSYLDGATWHGCYWVNGVRHDLEQPQGTEDVNAMGITVLGDKVYVAGDYVADSDGRYIACFWENGILKPLNLDGIIDNTLADSRVDAITVYDGKIVITGCRRAFINFVPSYWLDNGRVRCDFPGVGECLSINSQFIVIKPRI